jgi:O-antigen/teichoic acid export membrane protein
MTRKAGLPAQGISLRTNVIWTFLGNIAYGGAQWGMLVVIAKLGTPEMLGGFALALAVTAPVIEFSNLNLRAILATDWNERYSFGEYLGLRILTLGCAFVVITNLAVISSPELKLVLVIGLAKVVESISDILFGLMQRHERMDRIAMSVSVKGFLSLTMVALGMYATRSLLCGAICLMISWMLTLFAFDIRNARLALGHGSSVECGAPHFSLRPAWSPSHLRTLAISALPLGFGTLLSSLLVNIPRYFVGGMLGERELGIFVAMASLMIVGTRIITALGESALPRLAKYHHLREASNYRNLVLKMLGTGLLIGVAGVLIAIVTGEEMLALLYKPEYAEELDAFTWLMVAAGIGYVTHVLQYAMTAAQQFWMQALMVSIALVVSAAACIVLLPTFGIAGATMAVTAGSVAQLVGTSYGAWRILNELKADSKA